MPIHDWKRVEPCIFHDFRQSWSIGIIDALNGGSLPSGHFAMVGQYTGDESADIDPYVRKANRIVVKHSAGDVVAVIEIVSPGNKGSRAAWRTFVEKSVELLRRGIHLLIVDLFPPSPRDPQGVHKAIWDEFVEEPFELPPDKPLTIAAYSAGAPPTAYVEPVAVGDNLPPRMPIFLSPHDYIPAPLEPTYQATWAKCPEPLKELVE